MQKEMKDWLRNKEETLKTSGFEISVDFSENHAVLTAQKEDEERVFTWKTQLYQQLKPHFEDCAYFHPFLIEVPKVKGYFFVFEMNKKKYYIRIRIRKKGDYETDMMEYSTAENEFFQIDGNENLQNKRNRSIEAFLQLPEIRLKQLLTVNHATTKVAGLNGSSK